MASSVIDGETMTVLNEEGVPNGSSSSNSGQQEEEDVGGESGQNLSAEEVEKVEEEEKEEDVAESSDPVVGDKGEEIGGVEAPSENQQVDVQAAHQEKEAELEAYLESLKPKPKRKSIKEMLMSLPGYKNLSAMKPKIGGENGKKEDVIILDDASNNRMSTRNMKRQKQIEELKDRFVRHCITAPPKSGKGEHVKLKIKKKEEDSQGIEHLVENEVDYIRNPLNEEDEAVGFLASPQSTSPQTAPGASRRRLQETLLEQIRARKLKEHEERVKDFKIYNDENYENDKEGKSDEEEIVEDEELSEDESDVEDEEEELEDLLNSSSKKKKKKKSVFVDDEAEDEDGDDDNDDDDDDDNESNNEDSEDSDSTEDEDEKKPKDEKEDSKDIENIDDLASIGASEDSIPSAQVPCEKISEVSTPIKNVGSDDSQKSMDFGADFTPKVTTAVLNQDFKRTPSDLWIPAKSNLNCRQADELSPTIPRINKSTSPEETSNSVPSVPKSLANVISEPNPQFNDLVELCSGRFVSQVNTGLTESQEEDEFSGFDFGDGEAFSENIEDTKEDVKTPKADFNRSAVDGITPKLCEKVPKTRLLMQFDEEAEKTSVENLNKVTDVIDSQNNLEDDEEEIIGSKIKGRKQKRLHFSDDEDDGPEEMPSNSQSGDEQSDAELESEEEEAEEASQEIIEEKPISKGLFFNKHGQLKRKFVEDEAELSGSEEGSDDEDERGLNHYERDEADDEEIDQDALKNQVERAHLKQMLDDDDREIRRLQNAYLENGDLHSDKDKLRERKFTWKINMDELNDDANFGDSDEDQQDETADDVSQKQAWIEKRKWMSENSHLLEAGEDESQSLLSNSRVLKMSKNTIKRLESFIDTSTSESSNVVIKETSIQQRRSIYEEIIKSKNVVKKKENDLTSCSEGMNISLDTNDAGLCNKSVSQPAFGEITWSKSTMASKKGSFLTRGGMMLAKLAEGSKPGDAVSNIKSNSRNFVFQHITPPNPEKTDGSASRVKRGPTKAGYQAAAAKKLKIDRSFSNLDEASKGASIFKWL